jgi:hypothetical protein
MRRMFKTVFHNGEISKPIVTMMCRVDSGERLKGLDKEARKELRKEVQEFEKRLKVFRKELEL